MKKYTARLIENGRIVETIEFEADPREAWKKANDGVNPFDGRWVCVTESRRGPNQKLNGKHD